MHTAENTPRRPNLPQSRSAAPLTYTLNEACRISGLSRSTLYRHAEAARLRLVRVGGRTLVDAASLRALLGVQA
jgi:excisionase family DNA binding protein